MDEYRIVAEGVEAPRGRWAKTKRKVWRVSEKRVAAELELQRSRYPEAEFRIEMRETTPWRTIWHDSK